jgi:hypothetical protein
MKPVDTHLTLQPSADLLELSVDAWRWKIGQPAKILLITLFGDMFFTNSTGEVLWLNTGTGEIQKVANSEDEFRNLLQTDAAELWLLPELVRDLEAAGKVIAPQQCYTLITPPVFKEGKYEVDNIAVVPTAEHFRLSADLHKQIADLPDGARVRFKVIE